METVKLAAVIGGMVLGGAAGAEAIAVHRSNIGPAHDVVASPSSAFVIPRARGAIQIDGEITDPGWMSGAIARTGAFGARPYSDARFTWKDEKLYLVLYAADEDLQTTEAARGVHDAPLWRADSYRVTFKNGDHDYVIEIAPDGTVTDMDRTSSGAYDTHWESGVEARVDRDGSLDNPRDNDEEWVVEMAVPLASIGLTGTPGERVGLSLRRCDLSRGSEKRVCASWGEDGTVVELGP